MHLQVPAEEGSSDLCIRIPEARQELRFRKETIRSWETEESVVDECPTDKRQQEERIFAG